MTQTDRPRQEPSECKWRNPDGHCRKRTEISGSKIWLNPCVLCEPNIDCYPDFAPKIRAMANA